MKTLSAADVRRALERPLMRLPAWLVLAHVRQTGVALLAIGLLLAVWLLAQALFLGGEAPVVSRAAERALSVELIDRLELWIEDVDAERKAGLSLPARSLFIVDDYGL